MNLRCDAGRNDRSNNDGLHPGSVDGTVVCLVDTLSPTIQGHQHHHSPLYRPSPPSRSSPVIPQPPNPEAAQAHSTMPSHSFTTFTPIALSRIRASVDVGVSRGVQSPHPSPAEICAAEPGSDAATPRCSPLLNSPSYRHTPSPSLPSEERIFDTSELRVYPRILAPRHRDTSSPAPTPVPRPKPAASTIPPLTFSPPPPFLSESPVPDSGWSRAASVAGCGTPSAASSSTRSAASRARRP